MAGCDTCTERLKPKCPYCKTPLIKTSRVCGDIIEYQYKCFNHRKNAFFPRTVVDVDVNYAWKKEGK